MIRITLPDTSPRKLVFYLAMEEYIARNINKIANGTTKEYFFLWRVPPTVIFGRNQDIEAEVNLKYCKTHNIEFYRRKSGGGCVYADWGNIMTSYITTDTEVDTVFQRYLDKLASALQSLGFNAVKTEHNDVLIDGKKVSGNAFYKMSQSSIVHGTLLFDVDFNEMSHSITPSKEKLNSHGVKSVRQRVVNLKEIIDATHQQPPHSQSLISSLALKNYLESYFQTETICLSEHDIKLIEDIEKTYLDEAFIYGTYLVRRTGSL